MKTKQSMLYKRVQELNLHLTELLILGLLMCQQSLLVKLKVSVEWLMAKQTTTLVSVVIQLILAISSSTGLLIHYVLIFMLKPALHHLQNVLSISKKCQPKVLLQLLITQSLLTRARDIFGLKETMYHSVGQGVLYSLHSLTKLLNLVHAQTGDLKSSVLTLTSVDSEPHSQHAVQTFRRHVRTIKLTLLLMLLMILKDATVMLKRCFQTESVLKFLSVQFAKMKLVKEDLLVNNGNVLESLVLFRCAHQTELSLKLKLNAKTNLFVITERR